MPSFDNAICTSGLLPTSTTVSHGFVVARYSSPPFGSNRKYLHSEPCPGGFRTGNRYRRTFVLRAGSGGGWVRGGMPLSAPRRPPHHRQSKSHLSQLPFFCHFDFIVPKCQNSHPPPLSVAGSVSFHPLCKVLFTVRSVYLFAIGSMLGYSLFREIHLATPFELQSQAALLKR